MKHTGTQTNTPRQPHVHATRPPWQTQTSTLIKAQTQTHAHTDPLHTPRERTQQAPGSCALSPFVNCSFITSSRATVRQTTGRRPAPSPGSLPRTAPLSFPLHRRVKGQWTHICFLTLPDRVPLSAKTPKGSWKVPAKLIAEPPFLFLGEGGGIDGRYDLSLLQAHESNQFKEPGVKVTLTPTTESML